MAQSNVGANTRCRGNGVAYSRSALKKTQTLRLVGEVTVSEAGTKFIRALVCNLAAAIGRRPRRENKCSFGNHRFTMPARLARSEVLRRPVPGRSGFGQSPLAAVRDSACVSTSVLTSLARW